MPYQRAESVLKRSKMGAMSSSGINGANCFIVCDADDVLRFPRLASPRTDRAAEFCPCPEISPRLVAELFLRAVSVLAQA
jgi:hypothetical protein